MAVEDMREGQAKEDNCPWLVFVVDEVLYAVNTAKVQSIMKMPQEEHFVALPDAPEYIRSVVRIRDKVVPALDLRRLYGIASVEDEYAAFKEMIDARKQDHIHWVEALERSALGNDPFTLATDSHKCKFGQWYYAHRTDHQSVQFVMNKLEEPHKRLHEAALQVLDCKERHEAGAEGLCVKTELNKAKDSWVPKVLGLLDEVKAVFHHRYQEKLIVLDDGARRIALIVDDVRAIDELALAEGHDEFSELMQHQYVYAVGRGKKVDELILMIRSDELLGLVKNGLNPAAQD